jgi:hypothetical protein
MSRRDEIKVYNSVEERVDDYENFKDDWKYDADKQEGVHKSGLEMRFVILDRAKIEQPNLVEWQKKMEAEGLTEHEIKQYRVMLLNQFAVMLDENQPEEKEPTIDERISAIAEINKRNLELIRNHYHYSEEKMQQLEEDMRKNREELRKKWKEEEEIEKSKSVEQRIKEREEANEKTVRELLEAGNPEESVARYAEKLRKEREKLRKKWEQEKRLQQMESIREKFKGSKEDR